MKARACKKLQPQSSSGRDCLPPSSQPRSGYIGSSRRSPYCASSTPRDRPSRSHTYTATQTDIHCTNQCNRKNRASMKTRSVLCQPADTLVHDDVIQKTHCLMMHQWDRTHLGAFHVITALVLLYRWLAVGTRLWVCHKPQTIRRVLRLLLSSMH